MSFAKHVLHFYGTLKPNWKLPNGVDLIYPFGDAIVEECMQAFYTKFYSDDKSRHFLFGINPGRLGAGMTGIPFTDPIHLESHCGIPNEIKKKNELSSIFIYKMVDRLGGPKKFYSKFYITSLCPLGFLKDGKNYNYYDDKGLYRAVKRKMIDSINTQAKKFCQKDKAYSLGQGKNFKFFKELNSEHKWFEEVIPLPHPRWVMQYRRKTIDVYLDEYFTKLIK